MVKKKVKAFFAIVEGTLMKALGRSQMVAFHFQNHLHFSKTSGMATAFMSGRVETFIKVLGRYVSLFMLVFGIDRSKAFLEKFDLIFRSVHLSALIYVCSLQKCEQILSNPSLQGKTLTLKSAI